MATYTTNYNLEKPAQTDVYNVDVFNDNADKIDAGLTDKADKTMLAPVETTNHASRSYAKGEYFVYNNVLCCATTAIAASGTITIGTNCSTAPVGGELKSLKDALSNIVHETTIPGDTMTDSFGFIDTSLNVTNHVIIAAYVIGSTNQSIRVSNLANGNYRVQIVSCADNSGQGKVLTSGTYSTITLWYIDR